MSDKGRQDQRDGPGGRLAQQTLGATSTTLLTLVIVVAATAVSVGMSRGPMIGNVEAVFLAASLIAAVMFGLTYGLLAAIAALVAYRLFIGLPLETLDLRSEGTLRLGLFGLAIAITGLYTDAVRDRRRKELTLHEAGMALSAHTSDPALGGLFDVARRRPPAASRVSVWEEAQRAFSSICMVGAGLIIGLLARDLLGPTADTICVLTSVLIVAGLLGARFGFAAGILAVLLLYGVASPAMGSTPSGLAQIVFGIVVFGALGWGVGRLADRVQDEREALETLVNVGRDLSAGVDEASIRQVLFDSLAKIAPRGRVELTDDAGGVSLSAAPATSPPWSETDARWKTKRLAADGRDVGAVRWHFPGLEKDIRNADEIANSLIDLGAAAIVRARLNRERGDMELVARTEHLRTILLDAVSHHFRSPLAGILGSVTSILNLPDKHDSAMRRELLLIIKEQANRLSRYVDNFLSVARLESGSIDINLADVSVEPLIYDVWESFGEAGGARRFLQVMVDPAPIRTDESLLGQVLGNVLENAIKYSPEGSLVNVRGRVEGDRMILDVADEGPGVPGPSAGRIFDRFFRSQATDKPGLGLGLYITRSLVTMLGGAVEARNRPAGETGLVITLTLPLALALAETSR